MRSWITFFSMTGSKIYNVSRKLRRKPDVIVTNKTSLEGIVPELLSLVDSNRIVMIPNRPSVDEYEIAINDIVKISKNPLITLHGFLRVVPPEICEKYDIINCHPGLITEYPELKGKDPQKRAVDYPVIGTVLHRVTAGVDEGPVVASDSCDNLYRSVDSVTCKLKHMSEKLWIDLLHKLL